MLEKLVCTHTYFRITVQLLAQIRIAVGKLAKRTQQVQFCLYVLPTS
jgi:hypothetical protein